jgi:hypothetical protein
LPCPSHALFLQAPALLTLLMLPALRAGAAAAGAAPPPRVVFVSSIMHTVGTLDLNDPDYTGTEAHNTL